MTVKNAGSAGKKRQSICLNMIVKNEAPVIRRCLDSLRIIIDSWIIVDTGSDDGTQEIIREHLADLPGELFERPWKDFAHNRSEALELARGRSDYVLIIDADEVLAFDDGFEMPVLEKDAYHFTIESGGISYFKTQLVSNSLNWCFKNVLHEYIYCEDSKTDGVLTGVKTLRFPDGARARDPHTYRRDALILENALIDEPENTRYVFYLAQSYRDAGEFDLAIRHYQRRADQGGWVEEVWYSLYQIAEIRARREDPWPQVLEAYLDAYRVKPDRAEPLYRIGTHYQRQREFALAHVFLSRAVEIPFPKDDRLFIERAVYDYLMDVEYAVASYYIGDIVAALETDSRLLLSSGVPGDVYERVFANRRFSLDALFPKPSESARVGSRVLVVVIVEESGPWIDDCIESMVDQSFTDVRVAFIGTSPDVHVARLPSEERFVRAPSSTDFMAAFREVVQEQADADDIVVVLDGRDWLCERDALEFMRQFVAEHNCDVGYGQHEFATGYPGVTYPMACRDAFDTAEDRDVFAYPVFARQAAVAKALEEPQAGARSSVPRGRVGRIAHRIGWRVLATAGFDRSRFNDRSIVTLGADSHNSCGELS